MHIRPYQDSDQQGVIALWNEALPDSAPHNDPATAIRKKLAEDRDLFSVADVDGAVVGHGETVVFVEPAEPGSAPDRGDI